jgi:hypothetical protein
MTITNLVSRVLSFCLAMKFYRFSAIACLWLLSANQLNAFTSFSTASKAKLEKLDTALFSTFPSPAFGSNGPNNDNNNNNFGGNNDQNNNNNFGSNDQNNNFGSNDQNNNFGSNNGFSADQNDNFGSNGFNNDGPPREKQFRMVKQFNGDFKAVPYFEDDDPSHNPAADSEIRRIEQMYRPRPELTSPARALLGKQWDWERPGDRPRQRLRQVRTFSGDMKTVSADEYDPAFDHRVTNSEFGRIDGTGYVPPLSPQGPPMRVPRRPPSRQSPAYQQGPPPYRQSPAYQQGPPPYQQGPPQYQQGPPQYQQGPPPYQQDPQYQQGPPPYQQDPQYQQGPPLYQQDPQYQQGPPYQQDPQYQQDGISPARRREMERMERFEAKLVGDEFRREMRKYRQDEYEFDPEYDEEERSYDKNKPLQNLAKGTEKFLKQITGLGTSQYRPKSPRKRYRMAPPERREENYRMAPPERREENYRMAPPGREENFGWYQNTNNRPANEFESRSGSFNASPAIRTFEEQRPIPPSMPPPQYYGTNRGSTYYERGPKSSRRSSEMPSASRAVRSFNENERRGPQSNGPRMRMKKQFNGEFKAVPEYEQNDDEYYDNPAARSEIGRGW